LIRSDRYFDGIKNYVLDNVFNVKRDAQSYLEVGAGEYTTLVAALKGRPERPKRLVGLDLSWSRLHVGERHARANGVSVERSVVGDLFDLPFLDDSFEIVYTHHCIEQSPFDNARALSELYRVASRFLILIEPSYELGDRIQKRRMVARNYVRGLPKAIRQLGYALRKYELLPLGAYGNRPAVFMIEKSGRDAGASRPDYLACPLGKEPVIAAKRHLYCREHRVIYPVIDGIACLDRRHAIPASRFLEESDSRTA
jgi:SAM-dependent methyltransferase